MSQKIISSRKNTTSIPLQVNPRFCTLTSILCNSTWKPGVLKAFAYWKICEIMFKASVKLLRSLLKTVECRRSVIYLLKASSAKMWVDDGLKHYWWSLIHSTQYWLFYFLVAQTAFDHACMRTKWINKQTYKYRQTRCSSSLIQPAVK